MRNAFHTRTALAERPSVPKRIPYELLNPVRALRKELGLTPNDLAVLTALVSFLPKQATEVSTATKPTLTIVFPSNAALSDRANGIDERTLRRCVARLTASGLIARRDSANRKRFPLRYSGVIRDAFGFDLLPLFERQAELYARAAQIAAAHERLRSLRAEALALRAEVMQRPDLCAETTTALDLARTVLRRASLTVDIVVRIIQNLRQLSQQPDASFGEQSSKCHAQRPEQSVADKPTISTPDTVELSVTNGQNVRHIESPQIDYKKAANRPITANARRQTPVAIGIKTADHIEWDEFCHIAAFFPDPPKTAEMFTRVIIDIGKLVQVAQNSLLHGLRYAEPKRILLALDYLIARADSIDDPDAYFKKMIRA